MHTPRFSLTRTAAALTLLAASSTSFALDYSGYFRGGPGLTSKNTSRACYHLADGAAATVPVGLTRGLDYRLGNECDIYGEFQIDQKYNKDGVDYSGTIMVNHYTHGTDQGGSGFNFEQVYAQARGLDVMPGATFWIGKSRGRRGDVHIVDTFFVDMIGVGAGVKEIKVGGGDLGFAWYTKDGDSSNTKPSQRFNIEWTGVPSNPGGKANVFLTATKGNFTGGTDGFGATLRHDQDVGGGLSNTLWLQFAEGSTSLEANFGDATLKSSAKSYRAVESINWQVGKFGGQALAIIGSFEDNNGKKTTATTLGGRVSFGVTQNFKFVTELGSSQYKPDGGASAHLTKLTIAPTLSVGPDFWTRPELRLYATMAKWNTAAGNVTGQPGFAGKTSGNSVGAQVEWWF
jgi:maltoporin